MDVLAVWEAQEDGRVREQVVAVLRTILPLEEKEDQPASFRKQIRDAMDWLEGDAERWAGLIRSIEWRLGEPELSEVRGKVEEALNGPRPFAPPNLRDRLLAEVLDASIAPKTLDRCRTKAQLVALLDQADAEVSRWLATARGHGLVRRLEELDNLQGVLFDKPLELPSSPRPGQLGRAPGWRDSGRVKADCGGIVAGGTQTQRILSAEAGLDFGELRQATSTTGGVHTPVVLASVSVRLQ